MTRIREIDVAGWPRCIIRHLRGRDRLVDSGMGLRPLKRAVMLLTERPITAMTAHARFDHPGGAFGCDHRLGHSAGADIHADPGWASSAADSAFIRAGHAWKISRRAACKRCLPPGLLLAAQAIRGRRFVAGDSWQCCRDQANGLLSLPVIDHRK